MKISDYLRCLYCGSTLLEIAGSHVVCSSCEKKFPFIGGIPAFIDQKDLTSQQENQIGIFDKYTVNDDAYKLDLWQKSYVDRFLENFWDIKNKVVLDCGTGSGYMTIELAKKGAKVISYDLTLSNLVRLKKILRDLSLEDNVLLVCGSAEKLPVKDSVADFFISNALLEHITNEQSAIEETNRVCKLGSGLMITVPVKFKYVNPLFIPINIVHDRNMGHLRRYDKNSLEKKFLKWDLKRCYYTGHFFKVVSVLLNTLFPSLISEFYIENIDKKYEGLSWGSSNICGFFRKNV